MKSRSIANNIKKWNSDIIELKLSSKRVLPLVSLREYCTRLSGRPYSLKDVNETFFFTIKGTKSYIFETVNSVISKNLFFEDITLDVSKDESDIDDLRTKPEWMRYQAEFFYNLLDMSGLKEEDVDPIEFFTLGTYFYELAINVLHRLPSFLEFKKYIAGKGFLLTAKKESNIQRFYSFMRIVG